jgi:hypothetical protein
MGKPPFQLPNHLNSEEREKLRDLDWLISAMSVEFNQLRTSFELRATSEHTAVSGHGSQVTKITGRRSADLGSSGEMQHFPLFDFLKVDRFAVKSC